MADEVWADFQAKFLAPAPLSIVLTHLAQTSSDASDPITHAVVTMLTGNVQFCVGRYGLVLFRNTAPLPFRAMNPAQRWFIQEIVYGIGHPGRYGPLCMGDQSLRYCVENECIAFTIPPHRLEPKAVLGVLLDSVGEARRDGGAPLLANLLLQRIGARVPLTRETLTFAHERAAALGIDAVLGELKSGEVSEDLV